MKEKLSEQKMRDKPTKTAYFQAFQTQLIASSGLKKKKKTILFWRSKRQVLDSILLMLLRFLDVLSS